MIPKRFPELDAFCKQRLFAQVHYDPVLLDMCYLQDLLKSTMTLFF